MKVASFVLMMSFLATGLTACNQKIEEARHDGLLPEKSEETLGLYGIHDPSMDHFNDRKPTHEEQDQAAR